jgi:hypothetical protein
MDTMHFAIIVLTLTVLTYVCLRVYQAKSKA